MIADRTRYHQHRVAADARTLERLAPVMQTAKQP